MTETATLTKPQVETIVRFFRELPETAQTSVLVLDDEDDDELLLRSRLEKLGVELTWAKSPIEATTLISSKQFDFAVVDHGLGAGHESGSDWLYEHLDDLAETRVLIRTGLKDHLTHVQEFTTAGIDIAEKSTDAEEQLVWDPVEDFAEQRVQAVTSRVLEFIPPAATPGRVDPDPELATEVTSMFERWLESFPSMDDPVVEMDGELYSPQRLLEEARSGSGFGRHLKYLFVKQMWRRLGLEPRLVAAGER
jgi:ActR/RegA family two-component response regulator